jgi:hypothetical protein
MCGINQNPSRNEEKLARHEAQASDDAGSRVSPPLGM